MKNYIEYFFVNIFVLVSKIIGLKLSSLLGGIILYMFGLFSSRNKIGMKNLNIVFPKKEIRKKKRF